MDLPELVLHPVRLQIVHALSRTAHATTGQLADRLPDVPRTSIYRQVALLIDGGVVEVVGERRVRGGVERTLRLREGAARISPAAAAALTIEDHRTGFAAATTALLGEFTRYLDSGHADPTADQVGYRQGVVWLTPDERHALMAELTEVFRTRAAPRPGPGRTPHMMSVIAFPVADEPTGG